jgi:hypothetical protein
VSTQLLIRESSLGADEYKEHLSEGVATAEEAPEDKAVEAALGSAISRERPVQSQERAIFDFLADELAEATAGFGSLRPAAKHPAYREILIMGKTAVPFLLERVDDPIQGPLWMRLLGSLIGFPPMLKMDTVADAAEAWQIWGRSVGDLAS